MNERQKLAELQFEVNRTHHIVAIARQRVRQATINLREIEKEITRKREQHNAASMVKTIQQRRFT